MSIIEREATKPTVTNSESNRQSPPPETTDPQPEDLQVLADLGRELVVDYFSRLLAEEVDQPDSNLKVWLANLAAPAAPECPLPPLPPTAREDSAAKLWRLGAIALAAPAAVGETGPPPDSRQSRSAADSGPEPDPADAEAKLRHRNVSKLAYLQLPEGRAKTIMAMYLGVDHHQQHTSQQISEIFDLDPFRVDQLVDLASQPRSTPSEAQLCYELGELYPYLPAGPTKVAAAEYLGEASWREYPRRFIGKRWGLQHYGAPRYVFSESNRLLRRAFQGAPLGVRHANQQLLRRLYPGLADSPGKDMVAMYVGEAGYYLEHSQTEIDKILGLEAGQTTGALTRMIHQYKSAVDFSVRRQKLRRVHPALAEGEDKDVISLYLATEAVDEWQTLRAVAAELKMEHSQVREILRKYIYDYGDEWPRSLEARIRQLQEFYPSESA